MVVVGVVRIVRIVGVVRILGVVGAVGVVGFVGVVRSCLRLCSGVVRTWYDDVFQFYQVVGMENVKPEPILTGRSEVEEQRDCSRLFLFVWNKVVRAEQSWEVLKLNAQAVRSSFL